MLSIFSLLNCSIMTESCSNHLANCTSHRSTTYNIYNKGRMIHRIVWLQGRCRVEISDECSLGKSPLLYNNVSSSFSNSYFVSIYQKRAFVDSCSYSSTMKAAIIQHVTHLSIPGWPINTYNSTVAYLYSFLLTLTTWQVWADDR